MSATHRPFLVELGAGVAIGVAVWLGLRLGQALADPLSRPRLELDSLLARLKGGA